MCKTDYTQLSAFLASFFMLILLPSLQAQTKDTIFFKAVSYNVENLFDIEDDSLKNDNEFLPTATRHWDYHKYRKKLDNLAKVIIAVGNGEIPALVALCEVENDTVMHHLTNYSALREANYRYLMTNSKDERGIDVALLYQRHLFKPIASQSLSIEPTDKQLSPTRDVLHVSGLLINGDTLDVFVCHFPSRSKGTKLTEPYRKRAANRVKTTADSILSVRQRGQVLIMGDLNDYPQSPSIANVLAAEALSNKTTIQPKALYHLLANKSKSKSFGSYKYQGRWQLLDHLIVSGTLLQPTSPLYTCNAWADVYKPSFLLSEDERNGGETPFRTYYGMKYLGGYSDHLPIYTTFRLIYDK